MLAHIVAEYLQISVYKAQKLIAIFSKQNQWQEIHSWNGKTYDLAQVKTQADLISFLQAAAQSKWFGGHDRSKFSESLDDEKIKGEYYTLLQELGLISPVEYEQVDVISPDFLVVLGSSESQVKLRVATLVEYIKKGHFPKNNIVYGLGCNRKLGVSVVESESASKEKLEQNGQEATEMNMVSLIIKEALEDLNSQQPQFLKYVPINTTSAAKNRDDKDCVKTGDTAKTLKQAIESEYPVEVGKKRKVLIYSNQPFVSRQEHDVQKILGLDYEVTSVGAALEETTFYKSKTAVFLCLSELARLININYTLENTKKYDVPLSEEELHEIRGLKKSLAFFVSSVGDTDLAKATIQELLAKEAVHSIYIIPTTLVAKNRLSDLAEEKKVNCIPLEVITERVLTSENSPISESDLTKINKFIEENAIQRAYVGVPSPAENETPYKIACALKIPCTIAYEFMFKTEKHRFWNYTKRLSEKKDCDFVVSTDIAASDILAENPKARTHLIGHLSFDRALQPNSSSYTSIKKSLAIAETEEFVFISGTSQTFETDKQFLTALLEALETKKYPNMQIRFGIHPDVQELNQYLPELLKVCVLYPNAREQLKFIVPSALETKLKKLNISLPEKNSNILRVEISGPQAASAADKIGQALPGALLIEAAIKGKPTYYHNPSAIKSYLPAALFAPNVAGFFAAKSRHTLSRKELNLSGKTPELCAAVLLK